MKDILPKLLIGFSLLALGFGYGFASAHFRIFPYKEVRNAYVAFKALGELRKENPRTKNVEFWEETGIRKPLYRTVRPDAGSEPILILGNERTYADANGQSYGAWIADRNGKILHAWKFPGEIFELGDRKAVGDFWRSYPVGAYVYPNGDLLVSYQGVGMFPPAMGLAKFDKDSNILWKNSGLLHHWFSVGPHGEIYIPWRKTGTSPMTSAGPGKGDRLRADRLRLRLDLRTRLKRAKDSGDRYSSRRWSTPTSRGCSTAIRSSRTPWRRATRRT